MKDNHTPGAGQVVGRINSTALPSPPLVGIPNGVFIVDKKTVKMEDIEVWMAEREKLQNDLAKKSDLLGECLGALELILPLAKGYAADNRVGSNAEYISVAEDLLAKRKEELNE